MPRVFSRRSIVHGLIAGATACVAGDRRASAQPARMAGTAAFPVALPNYASLYVAMTQGFFKDEGLDFRLISGGSGTKTREILASGQADFALGDVTHCLQLNNRGRPSRILSASDRRSGGVSYIVRQDLHEQGVTSLQKLAAWTRPGGQKPIFGVSSLGGTAHVWATYFTEVMGIDKKFTWLGVGNVETMLGSLKTRQIDVLAASASMVHDAEKNGWGKLVFEGARPEVWNEFVGGDVPVSGHFTQLATINKDPAKVQAYVNGLYRSMQWIRTNSASAIYDAIEQYVGSTSREANLIEIESMKASADYDGRIDEETFARGSKVWFRDMTEIKPIARAEAVDDSFIRGAKLKYPT